VADPATTTQDPNALLQGVMNPESTYQRWLESAQTERRLRLEQLGFADVEPSAKGAQQKLAESGAGLLRYTGEDYGVNKERLGRAEGYARTGQRFGYAARGGLGSGGYQVARQRLDQGYRDKYEDADVQYRRARDDYYRQAKALLERYREAQATQRLMADQQAMYNSALTAIPQTQAVATDPTQTTQQVT
jgi:hypothetical protein